MNDLKIIYVVDDEELLSKKELCERILKCDEKSADLYFINEKDFPYLEKGNRKVYPKKLVEQWIANHAIRN